MTFQIALVLAILGVALLLFVTERVRMDLAAMLILVSLVVTGLITPAEALSGFSSPAVVTVWAVLILSAGLTRAGLAGLVGQQMLRLAGHSEARLVAVIMLTAAVLSGFMNNVGVAALMLPVVVNIARQTGRPPSRLLMPLAFATLVGGSITLIGTPPNLLISEALHESGLNSFQMFDFLPVGLAVTLASIVFMTLGGRHLLPRRETKRLPGDERADLAEFFGLRERLYTVRLPPASPLAGKSLLESRLGVVLGLNVVGILRQGAVRLAPTPETVLQADDRLLVEGRLDQLAEFSNGQQILVKEQPLDVEKLLSAEMGFAEVRFAADCPLQGQTLQQIGFRARFGAVVLAVRRGGGVLRTNLERIPLQCDDVLLVQGRHGQLDLLEAEPSLIVKRIETVKEYQLEERLMLARVPPGSLLAGKTLAESRLGGAYGLGVMGIMHEGTTRLLPEADERLAEGDLLLVKGRRQDLETLAGLQSLVVEGQAEVDLDDLESEHVGLIEVVLSPHSKLAGKTLRELHFRDKYGLSVLAIWRGGRAYRSGLRDMALQFGDALLLYGPRDRARVLGSEPDFLVLTESAQEAPRWQKAPLALLIMAGVLVVVMIGWLPIAIAAVMGMALMILTGCLAMDEAYQSVEWRSVFLIAGMLPMGIAMERTGAAQWLADGLIGLLGGWGPLAVMGGLTLLAVAALQAMPTAAVAVLLAPIAMGAAANLGVSPYPLLMAVAAATSAAFMSPVGHPSNVLIMGPGGYRFTDYIRVGLPLTIVVLAVALLVIPLFWPF
ncbi:MAG: SLC13 family permease [Anaerolineae bacterium]|nr:SLC13 family permease [Anaerolineae bacterium]